MGKLILRISVSIDGFIESSESKVDFGKTRSPEGAAWLTEKISQAGAHLMGRKAFSQLSSFWPTAPGPIAQKMNEIPKIVFSRKGFDPSSVTNAEGWSNAKVMTGDLALGLSELKKQTSKDLIAHGGVEFAQHLVGTGLVDEFWLATHPLAVGKGFHLFEKLDQPLYLKLLETKAFSTGAMINVYKPE
ncbi:dihydrofolate reductase family protein [Bdellovibrio sp. NC01]|uniref:dihydrofolate reductase family protein n=1 Tax=Bdellovibrio sp. NC01 TaxID=2220073 RepID=UPI00143D9771|nr:dihydrofolate reductase family protein [Bdellovibrio sp. NC01]